MTDFSAKIKHNEDTISQMAKAQYESFKPRSYAYLSTVSLAMLVLAVFMPDFSRITRGLFVAMGCFTLIGVNGTPRRLARQVVASLGGKFPELYYFFDEDCIKFTGGDISQQSYKEIIRLVESREYLFLFLENHAAYMIDKKYVKPDVESLKDFLAAKTGCLWTRSGREPLVSKLRYMRNKNTL